ncbi:MAG: DUF481 domain-containing protein [Pseudomonadales bacterium]|jgi:hypothetical protein|nr:DUF481 domain-containing protein [Pseudomonadales bacterium]
MMAISRAPALGAACLAFMISPPAHADGVDVVEFGNSRMVGQAKRLDRGKLYFKTDATGTIAIDWLEVKRLETAQTFRVEHRDGRIELGSFAAGAAERHIAVESSSGIVRETMANIVAFETFERNVWERIDISATLGYSFARSNGVQQLNFGADVDHEDERKSRQLSLASQRSESDAAVASTRRTVLYQELTFRQRRYLTGWKASYEDNDALQLDYRFLAAWVAGREYYPVSNQRVRLFAGIDVSEEQTAGEGGSLGSELVLGGTLDWFKFRSPELDLSADLTVFPSLSDSGRLRAKANVRLRWEMFEDLFWEFSVYDDFDNRSGRDDEGGSSISNDYGIATSLGWSW